MRRRRARKEIAFSFDSFLDLVANVVGIILKLILVAWVGARAYKGLVLPPLPPLPALAEPAALPEPTDSREPLLVQKRRELDSRRAEARERQSRVQSAAEIALQLHNDLAALATRKKELDSTRTTVLEKSEKNSRTLREGALTAQELMTRSKKLAGDLEALKKLPSPRKELRYRTPISAPVTEEVMFECRNGRVSLIDLGAFVAEIRRETRARGEELKNRWEVSTTTAQVGDFRLRYFVERERGLLEGPEVGVPGDGAYRYSVTGWELVPINSLRGESAEKALEPDSAFQRVIKGLDPQQTAVTLWVYPDSFPLYRKLRDYLHDRDIVVAGRPLPAGAPIASSRQGTTSRGQ